MRYATVAQIHTQALADLYGRVFPSQSFEFLRESMAEIATVCDCHGLLWANQDVVYREEPDTWECRIPAEYAVGTGPR